MKNEEATDIGSRIKLNLDNPAALEIIYRENKSEFKNAFRQIFPEIQEKAIAQFWHERLSYSQDDIQWGSKKDLLGLLILSFISGLLSKLPDIFSIDKQIYFSKNIGFIVFPTLMLYFFIKQKLDYKKILIPLIFVLGSSIYINLLPNTQSDSHQLAMLHLPIFLWTILGFIFIGANFQSQSKNINYLRFNGDLVVMGALIGLSGGLFSGLTIGLFSLIGIDISKFYGDYILVWALPAVPLVASYLVQTNPQIVNKISPTIARIFTPLVFVTVFIFLITMVVTGKKLYQDRDFLLLFNALQIGVMAIILFSLSEITKNKSEKFHIWILFGLSILTIISNLFALNAIGIRLFQFGITPNRLAVLGANLLIFSNLSMVSFNLFKNIKYQESLVNVEKVIGLIIPMVAIWSGIVAFIFPLIFSSK